MKNKLKKILAEDKVLKKSTKFSNELLKEAVTIYRNRDKQQPYYDLQNKVCKVTEKYEDFAMDLFLHDKITYTKIFDAISEFEDKVHRLRSLMERNDYRNR